MLALTLASSAPEFEPHFDEPSSEGSFGVITEAHPFGDVALQSWLPSSDASGGLEDYDDLLEGIAQSSGTPDCSEPRPVVIFSHGNGGIRWQSLFLTERLAAHGYVVAAPDHAGNTLLDDSTPRSEVASTRPGDVAAAFDFVVDQYGDCVDEDAGYAVIGHSFGGWTSLAVTGATVDVAELTTACESGDPWLCGLEEYIDGDVGDFQDERAWGAVPMTPVGAYDFASGLGSQDRPVLLMSGDNDTLTSLEDQVEPIYRGVGGAPKSLAILEGTGHFTFSEMCALVASVNGCEDEFLPPEQAHPMINHLTLAFLGQQRGFDTALPDLDGVDWL